MADAPFTSRSGPDEYTYDVFISYRHSELDSAAAAWLQKKLERYQIPKDLRKQTGRDKIRRVFRDREELAVAGSLEAEIREQLARSRYLVLVLSERTLESKWVRKEIDAFLETHTDDKILPVLVHGDPEAIYPVLFEGIRDGDWPLAADFRGETRAEVLRNARKEYLRLLAPIIGCSYDALVQRDRVYRNQKILGLSLCVLAALSVFSLFLYRQYQKTLAENRARLINESRFLARESGELLEEGKRQEALLVALAALPESEADMGRPLLPEAFSALQNALYTYYSPSNTKFYPKVYIPGEESYRYLWNGTAFSLSEDGGLTALLTAGGCLEVRSTADLSLVSKNEDRVWTRARFSGDDLLVAEDDDEGLYGLDPRTGSVRFFWDRPEDARLCGWYPQGDALFLVYRLMNEDPSRSVFAGRIDPAKSQGPVSGRDLRLAISDSEAYYLPRLAASPDRRYLACSSVKAFFLFSLEDGSLLFREETDLEQAPFLWLEDGSLLRMRESKNTSVVNAASGIWQVCRSHLEGGSLKEDWAFEGDRCSGGWSSLYTAGSRVYASSGTAAAILDLEKGDVLARSESGFDVIDVLPRNSSGSRVDIITEDGYLNPLYLTDSGVSMVPKIYTALRYYLGPDPVRDAALVSGNLLIMGDSGVYLFHMPSDPSGTALAKEKDKALPDCLLSKDGSLVLSAGREGYVLYAAEDGSVLHRDLGAFSVGRRSYLTAGSTVTSLSEDCTLVRIYDRKDDQTTEIPLPLNAIGLSPEYQVCLYAFGREADCVIAHAGRLSPDNALLIIDAPEKKIRLSLTPKDLLLAAGMEEDPAGYDWAFYALTPDGSRLFAVLEKEEHDRIPLVLDLETMTASEAVPLFSPASSYTYTDEPDPSCLWISPDCRRMALKVSETGSAVLDLDSGESLLELDHTGSPCDSGLCFTPDGKYLVWLDAAHRLLMADAGNGSLLMKGDVQFETGGTLAFYEDGKELHILLDYGSFATRQLAVLDRQADGTYKVRTSIDRVEASDSRRLLIDGNQELWLYSVRSLDSLLEEARSILDGRELTEEERKKWYITQ